MSRVRAYIGLGANLGDPRTQLDAACVALAALPDSTFVRRSPLYLTAPLGGPPGQPDYLNAVAALDTALAPDVLLAHLQAIEAEHGRTREVRWGPRTLDLDLLLYGDAVVDEQALCVPHPRLHQRAFVLYPLADLAPDLCVPGLGTLQRLLAGCPRAGIRRPDPLE